MESKHTSSTRPLHDRSEKARLEQDQYPSIGDSTYGLPAPLRLGQKIFLSHSGRDKEFVAFLYERLCQRYHDDVAFFDKETLPKAEPVSMKNILETARRSELGVLVLTEHFFTHTQSPMCELEAFVAGEVKLLPLFLTMSVDQFKEKERKDGWEKRWREWPGVNEEVIKNWRVALNLVSTFSGMEYCKIATDHSDYVDRVVKEVTCIVRPAISFSEEGVCGMDRLCEMVNSMYKKCASKRLSSIDHTQSTGVSSTPASSGRGEDSGYTLDVVGFYGFPGLGKTTLCKCLCDFFFAEFNGKVCHVDLAESPPSHQASYISQEHSRMLHVLSMLTGYNNEFQYLQGIGQVKNLLRMRISSTVDPVFFAIDNILPEVESQEEADFYLSCGFPKGSKIFITSRSESILTNLTSQHNLRISKVIDYMPKLEFEEARDILVHEFPDLREKGFSNLGDELQNHLNECVAMCTLHWERYHPMMLKSLAACVRWNRRRNRDWTERLRRLRSEGRYNKNEAWERVFKLLDNTYKLLSEEAKHVFLELALFTATRFDSFKSIWRFYPEEIFSNLQDLGFIECHENRWWRMLDLVVDFSKYKVGQQGANLHYAVVDEDQWNPQYAKVDEDQCNPHYVFPRSVRNVSISRCRKTKSTLDMTHIELRLLHLVDNAGLQKVLLRRATCAHLRSLIVKVPEGTSLCFILMDGDWSRTPFQAGNMLLLLDGNISFQSRRGLEITASPLKMDLGSILGRKLGHLTLSHMPSLQSIDVTTCVNLKELKLTHLPGLRFVRCLDNSHLEDLNIEDCEIFIEDCEKLSKLTFSADYRKLCSAYANDPNLTLILLKLPGLSCISGLDKSTSLKNLLIQECDHLRAVAIPSSLTAMSIYKCRSLKRITVCPKSSYPAGAEYYHTRRCLNIGTLIGSCPGLDASLLGEFLDYAGVDPSICKARVSVFEGRLGHIGLAGVESLAFEDVQHIELLISALFNARPKALKWLSITCSTHGGSCGCGQNPPHFGPLDVPPDLRYLHPHFGYHCPQVRDLASLVQWHVLQSLNLSGCTSVEVWPDFGAMIFLKLLNLSNTSLKKWPAGVQLLPDLMWLSISGCGQLSTQELTRVLTFEPHFTSGHFACITSFSESLREDLKDGIRDKCSVVDAIDALSPELVALFDRPSSSLSEAEGLRAVHWTLVRLLYEMWPYEDRGDEGDEEVRMYMRTKMRRLLCSTSFSSLSVLQCMICPDSVAETGFSNLILEFNRMKNHEIVKSDYHYYYDSDPEDT